MFGVEVANTCTTLLMPCPGPLELDAANPCDAHDWLRQCVHEAQIALPLDHCRAGGCVKLFA